MGKTSLELSVTGKEESWTAKEQLKTVHAAGDEKSGLLVGENQGIDKESWILEDTGGPHAPQGVINDNDDDDVDFPRCSKVLKRVKWISVQTETGYQEIK